MRKRTFILILVNCFVTSVSAQTDNYSDDLLSSTFKLFQSADFELAYHMLPFVRERFIEELEDSSSFTNSYDSLSNYIGIRYSSDSLLKTYCWSERNGSCCHLSATFAQFKTETGNIHFVDLEKPEGEGMELFITNLQKIEINNKPCYLILGWGTCCGGKHYETAKIYQIEGETLIQLDSQFDEESALFVGANRGQEIELNYDPNSMILSYNSREFKDDIGFYKDEKSVVKWKLKTNGFKRVR